MVIFALIVVSCVETPNPFGGSAYDTSYSKSCRGVEANLFATKDACEKAGEPLIGTPVFSDVADGRKVERYGCIERGVAQ